VLYSAINYIPFVTFLALQIFKQPLYQERRLSFRVLMLFSCITESAAEDLE
jgi:hypothetical protein